MSHHTIFIHILLSHHTVYPQQNSAGTDTLLEKNIV